VLALPKIGDFGFGKIKLAVAQTVILLFRNTKSDF
jgi:hypothetical protein